MGFVSGANGSGKSTDAQQKLCLRGSCSRQRVGCTEIFGGRDSRLVSKPGTAVRVFRAAEIPTSHSYLIRLKNNAAFFFGWAALCARSRGGPPQLKNAHKSNLLDSVGLTKARLNSDWARYSKGFGSASAVAQAMIPIPGWLVLDERDRLVSDPAASRDWIRDLILALRRRRNHCLPFSHLLAQGRKFAIHVGIPRRWACSCAKGGFCVIT